jgi:hypothetical protein
VYYNHPDQLTRESILELFQTRKNWASTHATWVEVGRKYADTVPGIASRIAIGNEWNRREIEYRRQFLGLPNREDYDSNWREWEAYVQEREELLKPKGAMKRFQVMVDVLGEKMKEAGELYEGFWDLEEALGSCVANCRLEGVCQASSLPCQLLELSETADGISDRNEIDVGCEEILKKLRANLKFMKSLQRTVKDSRASTVDLCEAPTPPDWVGGLTAPTHPIQRPEDEDPLRYL